MQAKWARLERCAVGAGEGFDSESDLVVCRSWADMVTLVSTTWSGFGAMPSSSRSEVARMRRTTRTSCEISRDRWTSCPDVSRSLTLLCIALHAGFCWSCPATSAL
eukprot:s7389_g1.t1